LTAFFFDLNFPSNIPCEIHKGFLWEHPHPRQNVSTKEFLWERIALPPHVKILKFTLHKTKVFWGRNSHEKCLGKKKATTMGISFFMEMQKTLLPSAAKTFFWIPLSQSKI